MWSSFVKVVIFYIIGILLGKNFDEGSAVIFIIALLLCALIKRRSFKKCIIIAFVSVGIIAYNVSVSEEARPLYDFCQKEVIISAKVVDLPEYNEDRNIYIVNVSNVKYGNKTVDVNEKIRFTSDKKLEFGESFRAKGEIKTLKGPMNEGDFDFSLQSKSKDIYFSMYSKVLKKTDENLAENNIFYSITSLKNKISKRISENFDEDKSAILHAMILGYKNFFDEETEEVLYDSSLMRLFYPTYIHLGFLVWFAGLFTRVIGRKKADLILLVLIFLYAVFNFNAPHIVKTASVLGLTILCKNLFGFYNGLDVIAIVVGLILFKNPLLVFHRGFVLSCSCNILILKILPIISKKLPIKNLKIQRMVGIWIVLWIGMIPIQAYMFSKTTPFSMILSFLFYPVMSVLFILAPFKLLLPTGICSKIFNWIMFVVGKIPAVILKTPFNIISLPMPSLIGIVTFYLVIFRIWLSYYRKRSISKHIVTGLTCILVIVLFINSLKDITKLKIDFVNVSQGDATVISSTFGDTIIIDGGGNNGFSDYNYGKEEFVPFLVRNGLEEIDFAVVSHYHSDHALGVIEAMKELNVKRVLIPDITKNNKIRIKIETVAKEKNIEIIYAKAGMEFSFNPGIKLKVISAFKRVLDENDTSLGIKLYYKDFSMLFMGDLSNEAIKRKSGEWGESTVLKVSHHGSKYSTYPNFLKEVKPKIALIGADEDMGQHLPNDVVLKGIERIGCDVYRTDKHGNIRILVGKNSDVKVEKFLSGE